MCGLSGVYRYGRAGKPDVDLVGRMNALQKHRGPDDSGLFADQNCVLGHRRLAIIDLSRDGRQPFRSEDGRYRMIYNGEIYNYVELRKELAGLGWQFTTRTDTEVLLNAYRQYGAGCLDRLNGMFAFAVYDTLHGSLFLARDRFGIKPLYYSKLDGALYFASEIKALLAIPGLNRTVNRQSLFDYLVFNRTDVFDETFFEGIKRLPQGHYAVHDADGLRLTQWWKAQAFLKSRPDADAAIIRRDLEEIFVSAVNLRMRSDVPVGSCLSGGLDSTTILGVLFDQAAAAKDYPTFTAAFPGNPVDETGYIDRLKRRYAFLNFRTFPTAESAYANLREFVYVNDEPTTNPSFYSQYEVMRLAADHGVTVLLDGQGGDENFAGYQYFHGFNLYGMLLGRQFAELARELGRCLLRRQHPSAYQTFAFQALAGPVKKTLLKRTLPYLKPEFFEAFIDSSRVYTDFFDAGDLNQSLAMHFQYKLEHLLRMEDRNSMAFSLEARVPYLDYRLVEYVLGVTGALKIKNGETKYIQKQALGHYTLPAIAARRDKIGFAAPGDEWMRTDQWQTATRDNYDVLTSTFPGVFRKNGRLPRTGFDRWKINQLGMWKELFLTG